MKLSELINTLKAFQYSQGKDGDTEVRILKNQGWYGIDKIYIDKDQPNDPEFLIITSEKTEICGC